MTTLFAGVSSSLFTFYYLTGTPCYTPLPLASSPTDRNFEPGWGLYNNSIGTVRDIVFAPGDDPNSGDLPQYVAVEFSHYTGPAWDPENPKVVPIPMVTQRCDKKCCCCVAFCPLELSFGMTSHTFQGQSAGPVDEGQPKNAVDRVIADPGTRSFEGNNPGTLYMMCSRATTVGTGHLDSAIYFSGPNMNRGRVLDLKYQKGTKKLCKKVALREAWVERLETKTVRPKHSQAVVNDVISWAENTCITKEQLDEALARQTWRIQGKKSVRY